MSKKRRVCKYGHDTWETGRYPGGNCAECSRQRSRQWGRDNMDRIVERNRRRLYGITSDDYARMVDAQGGVCATCGKPPGDKALCVDHDHRDGRVRGLLCHTCNRLLGLAGDDPEVLRRLIGYLVGFPRSVGPKVGAP